MRSPCSQHARCRRGVAPLLLLVLALVLLAAGAAGGPAPSALPPEKPDEGPRSFLHVARQAKSPLITPAYPLHRAVALLNISGVRAAVEDGRADVNQAVATPPLHPHDEGPYTPLRVAMESTYSCGGSCVEFPSTLNDISYYLLCSGANPNAAVTKQGRTPLFIATWATGNYALAYALLLSGANPNTADSPGAATALHFARCSYRQTLDVEAALTASVLLAFGANPGAKNSAGRTPLEGQLNFNTTKGVACAKPANSLQFNCYSTCMVFQQGLSSSEASDLRAGKVSKSLAAKLNLPPEEVREANQALADAAADLKACPVAGGKKGG